MRYAGVGSRNITNEEFKRCSTIATYLCHRGHGLNSGHADGSDIAFEIGSHAACIEGLYKCGDDIFLPYKGFNKKMNIDRLVEQDRYVVPEFNEEVERIVTKVVPYLDKLKYDKKTGELSFTWKAFLRNAYQVLGRDLNVPVDFLLCCSDWDNNGGVKGGTRVAYDLAKLHDIPCFNIRYEDEYTKFKAWYLKQRG